MSMYGFDPCSWGSSMLKPTERPPPSLQPRFAASITPGPPPVTTAQPASANRTGVVTAVGRADREHVDRVQREADVAEHEPQGRVGRLADAPAAGGGGPAGERPGERDQGVAPRREPRVPNAHVRAEERDEHRPGDLQPLPPRLDRVAELVDEQHQHEAERERPAPEPQLVRGNRDEEAEELHEDEAPLERGAADQHDEPADPLQRP